MSFYTYSELASIGFKSLGCEVKISKKTSIYNAGNIDIGDYSRIDDFCVLSAGEGGISIGRHVHIAVFCSLIGAGRIEFHDYSGMSARGSVYSSNDDYSGNFMTNPTVPVEYTNVSCGPVTVGRHCIIGSGSILLPGVTLHVGAGVGALSLVKKDCEAFAMYFGVPAKRIGKRETGVLMHEKRLHAAE